MLVLIGYSIPGFVLGVALLVLFAGSSFVQWFPLRGLTSDDWETLTTFGKIKDYLWHITLPVTASVAGAFAVMTMLTKNTFLEEIRKQYVMTARAKGLSERTVLVRHALANAAVPIVTVVGIGVALLIGGVVVTETVFAIPGLGSLTVDAVLNRDFPVIQGLVLLFSLSYVLINLLVDTSYVWLDPRIRH
jgi:microcin C transport system permease protein